jgi:hypothetical protein
LPLGQSVQNDAEDKCYLALVLHDEVSGIEQCDMKSNFSLRLLFIALTLIAIILGFVGWERERCRKQQIAVERLRQFGKTTVAFDPEAKSRSKWLQAILGDDSYSHAVDVTFYNTNPSIRVAGNEDLRSLTDLPNLQTLFLRFTDVNSDGLHYLRGLRSLRSLDLSLLSIDDASLEHLGGLITLEDLELMHTGIGDEGIAHLHGLTNIKSLNFSSTKV